MGLPLWERSGGTVNLRRDKGEQVRKNSEKFHG